MVRQTIRAVERSGWGGGGGFIPHYYLKSNSSLLSVWLVETNQEQIALTLRFQMLILQNVDMYCIQTSILKWIHSNTKINRFKYCTLQMECLIHYLIFSCASMYWRQHRNRNLLSECCTNAQNGGASHPPCCSSRDCYFKWEYQVCEQQNLYRAQGCCLDFNTMFS